MHRNVLGPLLRGGHRTERRERILPQRKLGRHIVTATVAVSGALAIDVGNALL